MQHAQDLRPLRQPARDAQARLVVAREPHAERAQAAQREIHVVGADAQAHGVDDVSLSAGSVFALADTQPNMMSEWPPIYLVPAWIDRSTPFSKARK